jgi:thioredoxin reductase
MTPAAWETEFDVVVIGGGAAGLAGAVALLRARRTVLVVDAGEPRNAPAEGVHNYLTREGTPPAEVLAAGRAEVEGYGGRIVPRAARAIERRDGGFRVLLDDGTAVAGRRLLVATGLVDELPDVPGVAQRWGSDVLHCPYCHGWEVRDQALGVLGDGPMAVHQALMWRQWSDDVVLFLHRAPEPTDDEREQLAARGVRVVEGEVGALDLTEGRMSGVRLASGEVVPRAALVVAPRFAPRAALLAPLGLVPDTL